jgi:hypothetical protein
MQAMKGCIVLHGAKAINSLVRIHAKDGGDETHVAKLGHAIRADENVWRSAVQCSAVRCGAVKWGVVQCS